MKDNISRTPDMKEAVRNCSNGLSLNAFKWEKGRKSNVVPTVSNVAPDFS